MSDVRQLSGFERFLAMFTKVQAGEGRCIAVLWLQAFLLMVAYYLIRPVREALILTEGDAEFRSYAVGVQALLLVAIIPLYSLLVRRMTAGRVFQFVNAFFALNLVIFFFLGQAGLRLGFVFFIWGSLFGVMAVTQFWAFASDLLNANCGQRLFSFIALGICSGSWIGSQLASAGFEILGPYGLMLAAAAILAGTIYLSIRARGCVPVHSQTAPTASDHGIASEPASGGRWLGGFAVIGRNRYLVGIAALVLLLNWITSTGDYVLSKWLVEVAHHEAPQAQAAYIGRFMGSFCSTITLVGFLVQLLLVSRIINLAGLARALMVTPIAFLAGYLLIGVVPIFALLQSVLVVQRSLDYSLLTTTRSALLHPASREERFQARTAIDTFFYRSGDLLSTLSVYIGLKCFGDGRMQFVWLIMILSATMTLVAWLIGREYSRRFDTARESSRRAEISVTEPGAILVQ